MKRLLIFGLLVVLVGLGIWVLLRDGSSNVPYTEPDAVVGLPIAPDFSFPDASGKEIVLSEVMSPLRIVHFWASWDPSSAEALRTLAEIALEYADTVRVIALNRDAIPAEGEAYLERLALGGAITFAYDTQDTYYRELGGYNMPETVFLGSDGEILHHARGKMSAEALVATITRLVE